MEPKKIDEQYNDLTGVMIAGAADIVKSRDYKRGMPMLIKVMDGIAGQQKSDCKKGCFFCCSAAVDITAYEFSYLTLYMRGHLTMKDMEYVKSRLELPFCPLLRKGECMVYEARPLKCRGVLSTSVQSCSEGKIKLIKGVHEIADDLVTGIMVGEKSKTMTLRERLVKLFKIE